MELAASTFDSSGPFKLCYTSAGIPYIQIANDLSVYSDPSGWTADHYRAFANRQRLPNLFFYFFPSNVSAERISWTRESLDKLKDLFALSNKEGLFGYYGLFFGVSGLTLYSLYLHFLDAQLKDLPRDSTPLGLVEYYGVPSAAYQVLMDEFYASNSQLIERVEKAVNAYMALRPETGTILPDLAEVPEDSSLLHLISVSAPASHEKEKDKQQKEPIVEDSTAAECSTMSIQQQEPTKKGSSKSRAKRAIRPEGKAKSGKRKKLVETSEDQGRIITIPDSAALARYKQVSIQAFVAGAGGKFAKQIAQLRNSTKSGHNHSPREFARNIVRSSFAERFLEGLRDPRELARVRAVASALEGAAAEFLTCKCESLTDRPGIYNVNGIPLDISSGETTVVAQVQAIAEQYLTSVYCLSSKYEPAGVQKLCLILKTMHDISLRHSDVAPQILTIFLNKAVASAPLVELLIRAEDPDVRQQLFCAAACLFKLSENFIRTGKTGKELIARIEGVLEHCCLTACVSAAKVISLDETTIGLLCLARRAAENPSATLQKAVFGHIHSILSFVKQCGSAEELDGSMKAEREQGVAVPAIQRYAAAYIGLLSGVFEVPDIISRFAFQDFGEFLSVLDRSYYNTLISGQTRLTISAALASVSGENAPWSFTECSTWVESTKEALLLGYATGEVLEVQKSLLRTGRLLVRNFHMTSGDLFGIVAAFLGWIKAPRAVQSAKLYTASCLCLLQKDSEPPANEEKCHAVELAGMVKEFISKRTEEEAEEGEKLRIVKQTLAKLGILANIRGSERFGIDASGKAKALEKESSQGLKEDCVVEEFALHVRLCEIIATVSVAVLKQPQDTILKRTLTEFNFPLLPPLMKGAVLSLAIRLVSSPTGFPALEHPAEALMLLLSKVDTLYSSHFADLSARDLKDTDEILHTIFVGLYGILEVIPTDRVELRQCFLASNSLADIISIKKSPQTQVGNLLQTDTMRLVSSVVAPPAKNVAEQREASDSELESLLLDISLTDEMEQKETALARELNAKWRGIVEALVDVQHYPSGVTVSSEVYEEANVLLGKIVGSLLRGKIVVWSYVISKYASSNSPFWNPNSANKDFSGAQIILGQLKFYSHMLRVAERETDLLDQSTFPPFAEKMMLYVSRALVLPELDSSLLSVYTYMHNIVQRQPCICGTSDRGLIAKSFFSPPPTISSTAPKYVAWKRIMHDFLQASPARPEMLHYLLNLHSCLAAQLLAVDRPFVEWVLWLQTLLVLMAEYLLRASESSDSFRRLLGDVFAILMDKLPRGLQKRGGGGKPVELQRAYGMAEMLAGMKWGGLVKKYAREMHLAWVRGGDIWDSLARRGLKLMKDWATREQGSCLLVLVCRMLGKGKKWMMALNQTEVAPGIERDAAVAAKFVEYVGKKAKKHADLLGSVSLSLAIEKLLRQKCDTMTRLSHIRTVPGAAHQMRLLCCYARTFLGILAYLTRTGGFDARARARFRAVVLHSGAFLAENLLRSSTIGPRVCADDGPGRENDWAYVSEVATQSGEEEAAACEFVAAHFKLVRMVHRADAVGELRVEIEDLLREEERMIRKARGRAGDREKRMEYEVQKATRKVGFAVYFHGTSELAAADW